MSGDVQQAVLLTFANTINTIGLAFLFTWLSNNTGANVLVAMACHGANNATLRLYAESADFRTYGIAYGLMVLFALTLVFLNRDTFFAKPRPILSNRE